MQTEIKPRRGHSIDQTADLLSVSKRTIERLVKSGDIRSVRVSARRRIIPDSEIDRLLNAGVAR